MNSHELNGLPSIIPSEVKPTVFPSSCNLFGNFTRVTETLVICYMKDDYKSIAHFVKMGQTWEVIKLRIISHSVSVLNEETIIAQSLLFLIAGYETSSTLLTFACYELALNQDIQQKLRKEIEDVLGKYGGHCSYEALLEMTYLDMVLLGLFNILCSS